MVIPDLVAPAAQPVVLWWEPPHWELPFSQWGLGSSFYPTMIVNFWCLTWKRCLGEVRGCWRKVLSHPLSPMANCISRGIITILVHEVWAHIYSLVDVTAFIQWAWLLTSGICSVKEEHMAVQKTLSYLVLAHRFAPQSSVQRNPCA